MSSTFEEQHSDLAQALKFADIAYKHTISINGIALSVSLVSLTQLDPNSELWNPHSLPFWYYLTGIIVGGVYMYANTLYLALKHSLPLFNQFDELGVSLKSISDVMPLAEQNLPKEELEEIKLAYASTNASVQSHQEFLKQSKAEFGFLIHCESHLKFLTAFLPILSLTFFLLGTIAVICSLNIPL